MPEAFVDVEALGKFFLVTALFESRMIERRLQDIDIRPVSIFNGFYGIGIEEESALLIEDIQVIERFVRSVVGRYKKQGVSQQVVVVVNHSIRISHNIVVELPYQVGEISIGGVDNIQ